MEGEVGYMKSNYDDPLRSLDFTKIRIERPPMSEIERKRALARAEQEELRAALRALPERNGK